MHIEFGATNVLQAIVGAMVNQVATGKPRGYFLEKVGRGLLGNDRLSKEALNAGVMKAVETGTISVEEAERFFGVDAGDEPPADPPPLSS